MASTPSVYESVIVNHPSYGLIAQIRVTGKRIICNIIQASEEEVEAMTNALNQLATENKNQ